MLKPGDIAPDFSLTSDNGETVSLDEYRGKKVVLYFYPKDMTEGCTKESCDFRDNIKKFEKNGVVVIGVSPDGLKSHRKFKETHELPFTLLSDESKMMLTDYGVWQEKSMYGRKYMGVVRTTYVIDEDGKIEKVYEKVKVPGHVEQILEDMK